MENYTRKNLIELICELLMIEKTTLMINNQINKYILDYGMSFKDIARCLVYWTEVKRGVMQPQYGIGIIPSIKDEAFRYFKKLEEEKEKGKVEAKKAVEYENNNIIINIKPSVQKRTVKQLDLNDIILDGSKTGGTDGQ